MDKSRSLVPREDGAARRDLSPYDASVSFEEPSSAPGSGGSLSLALSLNSLARWWKLAMVCGLALGALGAWYVWSNFTPLYRATAWFHVDSQPVSLAAGERQQDSMLALYTMVELIRSPAVLDEVVRRPELASFRMSPEAISHQLVLEQQNESELFKVSFDSADPALAAAVVNTVLEVYRHTHADSARVRTERIIELLDEDRNRRAAEIDALRTQIRLMIAQQPQLAEVTQGRSAAREASAALQERLIETEVEREVLRARLSSNRESQASGNTQVPEIAITLAINEDPRVQRLTDELSAKESLLSGTKSVSVEKDESPLIRQLRNEIRHYKERLVEMRKNLEPEVMARLREEAKNRQADEIAQSEAELESLTALKEKLSEQIAKQHGGLGAENPVLARFEAMQREVSRSEEVHRGIAARAEAFRTEVAAPGRITTIRPAKVPTQATVANPYRKMAAVGGAVFLLPFVLVILLDRQSKRIVESRQIPRDVGISVVGEVARLPHHRSQGTGRLARQRKVHDESVDAICTRLLWSPELRDLQVLATASAVSGEGKTHLASHLAVSLSRSSHDATLIIDADLRSPGIDEKFEISNDKGLADVLDGRCTAQEAIVTTWSKSLHILPAGRLARNPHGLFRSDRFAELMEELRQQYRYIIIDVPPVLAATESLIVAAQADATLVCAMREVSRAPQVKMAYEHLLDAGAAPLGVVLGGVPARHYESRYGAYYYAKRGGQESRGFDDLYSAGGNGSGNGGDIEPAGKRSGSSALPEAGQS